MAKSLLTLLCSAPWLLTVSPAATWYVDGSVPASGDGTSWESAFKTISEGWSAAEDGDTVIVAPGVYGRRPQATTAPSRVPSPGPHQIQARQAILMGGKNIVVRSTNPLDPDVVRATIIEGGTAFTGTENETCVLSGFTIQNGFTGYFGGGIEGGTRDLHTHATIENNIVRANIAEQAGGGIAFCDGIIRRNIVAGNRAVAPKDLTAEGGGLYECDGLIEGNIIAHNTATWEEWGTTSRAYGGGLSSCDGIIRNNIIEGNHAATGGGGLDGCAATIINNVVVDNSATDGGGVWLCRGPITNCIITRNEAYIAYADIGFSSQPTYSCVGEEGEGNTWADPRFVDEARGDFRLRPDSPCIDAGFNSPDLPEHDIARMPRIMFGGKSLTVDMGAYEFFYTGVQRGPGPDEATLVWSFVPDKTYSIFYTDDLFNWQTAIANFPSSGNTTTSWTDDGSLTGLPPLLAPKRFYRLLENP